ncbi:hypothetical protein W97_08270 [Coniosporium apollinis CBS 100218]|uniref:Peptidase S8/S53 domain-containing protein n=1 Tax=Coniosporium apollinis (strain CBS 100218) TaxID=1168221 RepID=R7Z4C4_CONA1|nr:uncharacterized protein W97_08270 [Coniosporium apollinis CBS 100218]EON69012.1 hypothetical protein W97_08270 [Coniosporium apollinis CBS 100218]
MSLITINGHSLDIEAPVVQALSINKPDARDSNYILIQTNGDPSRKAEKTELDGMRVGIEEYVSDNTYLCTYNPEDSDKLRKLPYVKYANVYLQEFVVQPSLKTGSNASSTSGLAATRKTLVLKHVDIVLHIKYIQEVHPVKLHNNVARGILEAGVTINDTPYKGKGEIVRVADTGFVNGNDSSGGGHRTAFGSRHQMYLGTHVCDSVLGDGDHSTEGRIEALASEAELMTQSLLNRNNGLGGIPDDLNVLFKQAWDEDARIHTNSWESSLTLPGLQVSYGSSSTAIDKFVCEHPEMVILFAAGNDGTDRNKNGQIDPADVGSEAAAKNLLTVGATERLRPDIKHEARLGVTSSTWGAYWPGRYYTAPIFADHMASNSHGMAAFSSRGPTKERRYKPDVVAPGTSILSALSGKVLEVLQVFGISGDEKWWYCSGTSTATPLVAGCCAVLRQTLRTHNNIEKPTAILIKAVLINGAVDVDGQYHPSEVGPAPPNNFFGFGRVNAKGSLIDKQDAQNKRSGCGQSEEPLNDDDESSFTIPFPKKVEDDDKPAFAEGEPKQAALGAAPTVSSTPGSPRTLKITLVWSDPPAEKLQNDLDLIVEAGGKERHGNMGKKPGFDRQNNVEQVLWAGYRETRSKVTVRAYRITKGPQHFACA